MSEPLKVIQVKPKLKIESILGTLLAIIANVFLAGWLLWLIIPAVTPWALGYWQCILLFIGCNILFKKSNPLLPRLDELKDK